MKELRMILDASNICDIKTFIFKKVINFLNIFRMHKEESYKTPNSYLTKLLIDVKENKNLEEGSLGDLFKDYFEK